MLSTARRYTVPLFLRTRESEVVTNTCTSMGLWLKVVRIQVAPCLLYAGWIQRQASVTTTGNYIRSKNKQKGEGADIAPGR